MPDGVRKTSGNTLQIGEHAVAPLVMQLRQRILEKPIIFHAFGS
jgi:hypothetical protein